MDLCKPRCGLVITSYICDLKQLNRLLLYIRDWDDEKKSFHITLVTSFPPGAHFMHAKSPLTTLAPSEWLGWRYKVVERMLLTLPAMRNTSLFLMLDDQGCAEQSVVVLRENVTLTPDPTSDTSVHDEVHVPWDQVHEVLYKLSFPSTKFSSFCTDSDTGDQRWWTFPHCEKVVDEGTKERDREIYELTLLDLA